MLGPKVSDWDRVSALMCPEKILQNHSHSQQTIQALKIVKITFEGLL